jgi:hypothetical protein
MYVGTWIDLTLLTQGEVGEACELAIDNMDAKPELHSVGKRATGSKIRVVGTATSRYCSMVRFS